MLGLESEWRENKYRDMETSSILFLVREFVGPVVRFELQRFNGEKLKAFPKENHVENVSFSMSDLEVLKMASKELFNKFGTFVLCIPLFEVEITCEEDAESKIEEKLLNITLF